MLSLITHAPNCFIGLIPQIPSTQFEATANFSGQGKIRSRELRFLAANEASGFLELKKSCWACGAIFVRRCNISDGRSDFALESDILEFIKNSENPEAFPSKKQLIDAGRMDLVEAISKDGGWLALGWGCDDNVTDCFSFIRDKEGSAAGNQEKSMERYEEQSSQDSCPTSSGRSLETAIEGDAGIDGILCRLDRERIMNLGFALKEAETSNQVQSNDINYDWLAKTTKKRTVGGHNCNPMLGSLNPNIRTNNDRGNELDCSRSFSNTEGLGNSQNLGMWRTWSVTGSGSADMPFEAEEITTNKTCTGVQKNVFIDEILETREGVCESVNKRKENSSSEGINEIQVRNCLRNLELELSSALQALKSNGGESVSQKVGNGSTFGDLLKLSDAWEFQEDEIINAQHKLRSIRAKLAVVEGKMALAIIDAQKFVEEKQKRIDVACKALHLLRSVCLVWSSPASEVLLAGSFDGWATQRRMERSTVGIFSLHLKLYPGRYEIKFIVDGEWRIDPLRPIVHNNGHENNLLIVT